MTDTFTLVKPQDTETDTPELFHYVCDCDVNTALCGLDVTDAQMKDEGDDIVCVVCYDLVNLPCKTCGWTPE
jgi:hypothetical protein